MDKVIEVISTMPQAVIMAVAFAYDFARRKYPTVKAVSLMHDAGAVLKKAAKVLDAAGDLLDKFFGQTTK